MEDGMNPPPSQAMTADPSVVAAAVRVCDDALASPTVEFLSGFGFGLKHKTVTIPVANPAGAKILSIVIEIPEYGVWHGSIVTAEGVCVARVSQKECLYPGGQWIDAPPVPIEWGGAHFGEVNHDFIRNPRSCSPPKPITHAQGPVDRVDFAEDFNSERYKLCKLAKICGLPCFGIVPGFIFGCFACMCYPLEFDIKDSAGEKVGGFEKYGISVDGCFDSPGVLHFDRMTSEQRRLALVVGMYSMAQHLCQPPSGGGGGAEYLWGCKTSSVVSMHPY